MIQEQELVEVTQEEFELAVATWQELSEASAVPGHRVHILEQAFARHRLTSERAARNAGPLWPGLDHIAHFINALDTEGMSVKDVRSAIYAECLSPAIRALSDKGEKGS